MSIRCKYVVLASLLSLAVHGEARSEIVSEVDGAYPESEAMYVDVHQHPELSHQEDRTAAKLAGHLRSLGYEVTTGVGGTGVVGMLKNGSGPVVMLRTELDALPLEEKTGLPYASQVRGVMHACGHDAHIAALAGTARIMARTRNSWRGTLVLIGQPAEETGDGARAMLADGLFTRFPRPDHALAVHSDTRLPAGMIGYHAGPVLSNFDTVRVTIFGRGGHGARPETTIDPVVIAARTVLALQTIVSREISPFDAAVVTVGSIHGGTRANIIPDEVRLELTVRSLTESVRQRLLGGIERISNAESAAAGSPREPSTEVVERGHALINDPALTQRVVAALQRQFASERVQDVSPEMASEDFSEFHRAGVPTLMLRIGAVEAETYAAARASGSEPQSLHSPHFAPDRAPTIKSAIAAEVIALRELMPIVPAATPEHSSGTARPVP